jgi:mannosyltransferase
MNIIFDNIIYSLQHTGGGSVYWSELIQRFCLTNENISFVEQDKKKINIFRNNLNIKKNIIIENRLPIFIIRILPLTISIKDKSIFHSSYYRYSNSKKAINVLTLHDFTAEYFMKGIRRNVNYIQKKQAIKKANGIICISKNTKNDLLMFHPWVNENKIRIVHNGVSNDFFPLDKTNTDVLPVNLSQRPYILYVGHRTKQYKNFDIAIKTLHKLPDEFILAVAGEPFTQEEEKLIQTENLKNRIILIERPSVKILNILYNYAYCFLYPSSYEGFGIPVIEAMKTGCPVVAVKKSSIPDVAGDAAILAEDVSPEILAQSIIRINIQRNELIKKGIEQAKKYSWDKCFNEVYNFYRELYENNK